VDCGNGSLAQLSHGFQVLQRSHELAKRLARKALRETVPPLLRPGKRNNWPEPIVLDSMMLIMQNACSQ